MVNFNLIIYKNNNNDNYIIGNLPIFRVQNFWKLKSDFWEIKLLTNITSRWISDIILWWFIKNAFNRNMYMYSFISLYVKNNIIPTGWKPNWKIIQIDNIRL